MRVCVCGGGGGVGGGGGGAGGRGGGRGGEGEGGGWSVTLGLPVSRFIWFEWAAGRIQVGNCLFWGST